MNMRTPLGRVRGHGSAREGTEHFWRQRLTALANIPLVIFLVWLVVSLNGASHGEVVARLSSPFVAVLLVLTVMSIVYHMRIGMQVVIEDYVHGRAKLALLILNTFFAVLVAAVSVFAILKLAFGG